MDPLTQWMQEISVANTIIQFTQVWPVLTGYHENEFMFYQQQNKVKPPPRVVQLTWADMMGTASKSAPSTPRPPPSKTRVYKARQILSGFCNNGKLYQEAVQGAASLPPAPKTAYTRPNPNKLDRMFGQSVVKVYEFTQEEWVECARKYVKDIRVMQWKYEPLTTYCRSILRKDATPPNIFGAKLTPNQAEQLMDAHYWLNLCPNSEHAIKQTASNAIFYYKLFGWHVRNIHSYRRTKSEFDRRIFQKRAQLMAHGSTSVQLTLPTSIDGRKSDRGRKKRKVTM